MALSSDDTRSSPQKEKINGLSLNHQSNIGICLQKAVKLYFSCAHHLGAASPPSPGSPDSALRAETGPHHAGADRFLAPSLAPRPFDLGVRAAAACGGEAPSATKGRLGPRPPPHSPCPVFAPETVPRRHLLVAPRRAVALGDGIRPGGARRPRSQKPQPGPAVPQRRAPPAPARAATRLSHPALHVKSPLRAWHAGKAVSGDPARGRTVNGSRFSSSPLCTRPQRAHFSELRIPSQLLKVADGKVSSFRNCRMRSRSARTADTYPKMWNPDLPMLGAGLGAA
nr:uncharacterized protein LOC123573095 [Macaca fascicularis]